VYRARSFLIDAPGRAFSDAPCPARPAGFGSGGCRRDR